jgi:hypothetical protein
MRSFVFALTILSFFIPSEAFAQEKLSQKELEEKLKKLGIELRRASSFGLDPDAQSAYFQRVDQNTLRGLDLLRQAQNLAEIVLDLKKADAKSATACLERLNDFPKLKYLHVRFATVRDNDVKWIARVKSVERLDLECPGISEGQIKSIGEMKSLKYLHLTALEIPPKSAKVLRAALPKIEGFQLQQIPAIHSTPPLKIADNDTPLVKAQKAKVNSALKGIKLFCVDRPSLDGARNLWNPKAMELMRELKDALLELDDPILTERIVQDYVQLTEIAFKVNDMVFTRERFDGGTDRGFSAEVHLMECIYLDAQILQLKMKKKRDNK